MSGAEESNERRGLLPRFTLKDDNTFLLVDALGDIQGSDDGLFTDDTRILSRFELKIAGRPASLLGAGINQNNTRLTSQLTNRALPALGEGSIPQGAIHIVRNQFIFNGCLHGQFCLTNFGEDFARVPLSLLFAADFVDIFEVQGHVRKTRGAYLPAAIAERSVTLTYRGRDDRIRSTRIIFSRPPCSLSAARAEFAIELPRGETRELFIEVGAGTAKEASRERFELAAEGLEQSMGRRLSQGASITTSVRLFNAWIDKSRSDLALLTTPLPTGPYPYAGIPWFATQFGRDGIITALETLWINPQLAAGVLSFLASTQAQEESAFSDAQPGKIMHETRRGEMAALREVPFGQYYGGVDTTPLFVMLAGAYERRTGDRSVVDRIWPAVLAAMRWIERRMEASPTGFLDYARGEKTGLVNQSWKDSNDAIFHADGSFPKPPIAVVEVQGYAYAALQAASELARIRDEETQAAAWSARADALREAIELKFWVPELNSYAIALDGDGNACRVRASNAGHLLFCGVPTPENAKRVANQLLSPQSYSGWGIRTLSKGQPRFNPMSYHNGSIWPHDVAICAAGIARYDGREQIGHILSDIFEAANHFSMRLPELYCGFERIPGQGPTPYPVACLPQAWASACVFLLLQATLGVRIDGWRKEVHIEQPVLPAGVDSLTIRDLVIADTRIDLEFHRIGTEVAAVPSGHTQGGVKVMTHL